MAIDPTTGDMFPPDSPYQNVEIVRALFHAAGLIEGSKGTPGNSGTPWTADEEHMLLRDFRDDVKISEIAKQHGRSSGAIRARLKKLGVIDE